MSNEAGSKPADAPNPSCESCRKRKLRCTRQYPTCDNCEKFAVPCIYDAERKRPGFKVGAVEGLNRRLEVVEQALSISQRRDISPLVAGSPNSAARGPPTFDTQQQLAPLVGVMSTLTNELRDLSAAIATSQYHGKEAPYIQNYEGQSTKRRKTHSDLDHSIDRPDNAYVMAHLVGAGHNVKSLSEGILDAYFQYIQPWLSILHEPSVRKHGFKDNASPINQAITFAAVRFVKRDGRSLPSNLVAEMMSKAKNSVLVAVTGDLSVENVQALLILTYIELVDDHIESAISLIGIISHHIQYLRLSCERGPSEHANDAFGNQARPTSRDEWINEEEERRAFWIAIMLDRLCAIITGCRPSITGPNMKRRLPVCASYWFTNQAYRTPYMHVSDVLRFTLSHPIPLPQSTNQSTGSTPSIYDGDPSASSGIGALAFFVETVESMSMVVGFFLDQSVDFENRNVVSQWLTRFKEIDAYLMWWKMHLPQQWADSGVSRRLMPGIIDPAMAAANATHNTCLILLHSEIAYPDPKLQWVQLPSACSAEICVNAAVEVCVLIRKFAAQRTTHFPLSPQLGLCAFLSARGFLLHRRYYLTPLAPEFYLLLQSLDDMACRWQPEVGPREAHSTNLFHCFAERLRKMQAQCEIDPTFSIDRKEPLHRINNRSERSHPRHWIPPNELVGWMDRLRSGLNVAEVTQTSLPANDPPTEVAGRTESAQVADNDQACMPWAHGASSETFLPEDNVIAISEALMGPEFTDLNRILSFDEMMMGGISEAPADWNFGQS